MGGYIQKQHTGNIKRFVQTLTLNSDEEVYDGLYLSNYANLKIIDELSRLPGVGGVTVNGTISGMQRMVDKKGRTTLSFNVMGIGINAQIEIYMSPGTNQASATIYPNFNSNTVWVQGQIVPYESSDVFEGT